MTFPPCDGKIKNDLWLDKSQRANLARQGSRKWNESCDWPNNGKECCSDVSSRFFGGSIAWHPKKWLRRRLGNKLLEFIFISAYSDQGRLWSIAEFRFVIVAENCKAGRPRNLGRWWIRNSTPSKNILSIPGIESLSDDVTKIKVLKLWDMMPYSYRAS